MRARLHEMGWNAFFETQWNVLAQPDLVPARVVEELRGLYRVRTSEEEFLAGGGRESAVVREWDFPPWGIGLRFG